MTRAWVILVLLAGAPAIAAAQTASSSSDHGFWRRWFERSDRAKAAQPHWITPLATTTPRLEQEFRFDTVWQRKPDGAPIESYGGGKGLELIPFDPVEVIVGLPAYVVHDRAPAQTGFGDLRILMKYRLAARDEASGGYIVTAFVDLSAPTGSEANGVPRPVVTATLAYGKGFGRFDLQGTLAFGTPTSEVAALGRTLAWNNAVQYRLFGRLWPEVEVNSTFFDRGTNDGRQQTFVTPGVVVGRLPLAGRLGLTLGAGVQIAVSRFRTSTHNAILSVRLPF